MRKPGQRRRRRRLDGHLFAQDRTTILEAMNQAVSRLYAYENGDLEAEGSTDAVA